MHYFKDKQGIVYAYDNAQIAQGYGKDLTPITSEEKDELTKPEPTTAELAERARAERDRLMREAYDPAVMQLMRKRRVPSSASEDVAGIDAQLAAWDAYANALEAVPDQPGFPESIDWPATPTE